MSQTKKCPYCGEEIQIDAIKCRYCREMLPTDDHCHTGTTPPPFSGSYTSDPSASYGEHFSRAYLDNDAFATGPEGRARGIAALLAILLGSLGIHYFYLGKATGGIVYLILTVLSCGTIPAILSLIQGIMMFCMTNDEFRRRYVTTTSSFPF